MKEEERQRLIELLTHNASQERRVQQKQELIGKLAAYGEPAIDAILNLMAMDPRREIRDYALDSCEIWQGR
ncbi:hypothetical protein M1N79_03015 [Dehalococcoidia bacterium]|nr:hypothetical protein [Dehalococcoidia bacterium]